MIMKSEKNVCRYKNLFIKILLGCFVIGMNTCYLHAEDRQMNDKNSMYDQEVKFPIDAGYFMVNGSKVNTDTPDCLSEDGVIMIPLRSVCSLYGIKDEQIIWDEETGSVKIINNGSFVKFAVDKNEILIDNDRKVGGFEGYPRIKVIAGQSRLYVPITAFGFAYGLSPSWDKDTNTAILNEDLAKATGASYKLESPKLYGQISDWEGFIVYDGKIYRQAEYLVCDEAVKKLFKGERLGRPSEFDVWSSEREYTKEFTATVPGYVYSVKGYDKGFRICIPQMYENSDFIAFFESFDGIALKTGKDLYGDRLHIKENYVAVTYQLHEDWNYEKAQYKDFKEFTDADYDTFFDELYKSDFMELSSENNLYASNSKQSHLYIRMRDKTTVELRLFENGYIGYKGLPPQVFLKMNNDIYHKFFQASLK